LQRAKRESFRQFRKPAPARAIGSVFDFRTAFLSTPDFDVGLRADAAHIRTDIFQAALPDVAVVKTTVERMLGCEAPVPWPEAADDGEAVLAESPPMPTVHTVMVEEHECCVSDVRACDHHGRLRDGVMRVCVRIVPYREPTPPKELSDLEEVSTTPCMYVWLFVSALGLRIRKRTTYSSLTPPSPPGFHGQGLGLVPNPKASQEDDQGIESFARLMQAPW